MLTMTIGLPFVCYLYSGNIAVILTARGPTASPISHHHWRNNAADRYNDSLLFYTRNQIKESVS